MEKILIVEDDIAFGTMIQTWLRKKGFEVAYSPRETFHRPKTHRRLAGGQTLIMRTNSKSEDKL